jgi:hypothetical protein
MIETAPLVPETVQFTTNFVLAESHALILARMGRDRAWGFL